MGDIKLAQFQERLREAPISQGSATSPTPVDELGDDHAIARVYFPRHLTLTDRQGQNQTIDEEALLALAGNTVILGEPGMGKSELIHELGRRLGIKPVTAIRFINARQPEKLVEAGQPLLIDGLDEAMSRGEGDTIDAILAQLEAVDLPPFILACRSREWQSRGTKNIGQLYGNDPNLAALDAFDVNDARAFLGQRYARADPNQVLGHLSAHSLEELYRNPLALSLIGRVAETDDQLPATRAALFERVCTLIWSEHDPDRQDEGLGRLSQADALDAAGAISAALLFAGAEAVSAAGAAFVLQDDLPLADIEALPLARTARTILSSKLFHSIGPARARPIHRVIAEFLGARWLAKTASSARICRRLLAQFHGGGGVPASLRGLHAWLAYHSPRMARSVIAKDPYGVLRYGETASLPPHLADHLLDALVALAKDDPLFRSADWDTKTAAGLMVPALASKVQSVIASSESNEHLRSLLIEGLVGVPLAADLSATLEAIVLSPNRFYRERSDAIEALMPHRSHGWWGATIGALTFEGGEDGPRLARLLIQRINFDVSNGQVVETVFAELGITSCPLPHGRHKRRHIMRSYDRFVNAIPVTRTVEILDLVLDYTELLGRSDWDQPRDIADIVAHLMVRIIDEGLAGPDRAPAFWRWLSVMQKVSWPLSGARAQLAERLGEGNDLRHAIQAHVLENERPQTNLAVTDLLLRRRFVGISGRPDDVVVALGQISDGDYTNAALREDWKALVIMGSTADGFDPAVRAAANVFAEKDGHLADFLKKAVNPQKQGWEKREEKEAAKRVRKNAAALGMARRELSRKRDSLRAGDLAMTEYPARLYFDRFQGQNSAVNRVMEWAGPAQQEEVLAGFEATLHRSDLPSATEIADGFAHQTIFPVCFPLMAGLYERLRLGRGISDLPNAIKRAGLLLCYDDHGWNVDEMRDALRTALEAEILATPAERQAFAELWIEPALVAGNAHVQGLYPVTHDPAWESVATTLAEKWLNAFGKLPERIESELIDCLASAGARETLLAIAKARAARIFCDFDRLLLWLAVDVWARFDAVRPDVEGIGTRHPEFIWFLRDRLQLERRGALLPLSVSQAEWIVTEFREHWRYAELSGSGSGTNNDYDATDFLRALINRIADDTSADASAAMTRLVAGSEDSYSHVIRHMAAEQRQKRAENDFAPLRPNGLLSLLDDGPPETIEDLKALVLEEMDIVRRKLIGDDLDSVIEFWSDRMIPRDENRCRDRLVAMLSPQLLQYDIYRMTEVDMPQVKRADIAFARGSMQLPVEVKGQWHPDVWDAATGQLDTQYLIDWRSEQRGIYCVLWFGDVPSSSNRRLKPHPDGLKPKTAKEMETMLTARIPQSRHGMIDVMVFDLTGANP